MKINAGSRTKFLVSILFTVAIIIGGGRFFILEQWARIQDLIRQQDRMVEIIRQGTAASAELSGLKRDLDGLEQELQTVSANFFMADQSGAVVQLMGLLQGNALAFIQPGEVVKREYFSVLPVQVGLKGSYSDVLEGLRSLNNSPQKIQVAGIVIKSEDEKKETGSAGGQPSGPLNAEVQLLLYQYPDNDGTVPALRKPAAALDFNVKSSPFKRAVLDNSGRAVHPANLDAMGGEARPAALCGEDTVPGWESQEYGFSCSSFTELEPYCFPVK